MLESNKKINVNTCFQITLDAVGISHLSRVAVPSSPTHNPESADHIHELPFSVMANRCPGNRPWLSEGSHGDREAIRAPTRHEHRVNRLWIP